MTHITESEIEEYALSLLENLGYSRIYGPDIAPDGERPERVSYEDVILKDRLRRAVERINAGVPPEAIEDAIRKVERIHLPDLMAANREFHRMLTGGVKVSVRKDGEERGEIVWLMDFENPENNEFLAVNQFTVIENGNNKRPDIVLFINGIPMVVMELKNPADENATLSAAHRQIQTYKATIPSLFTYNEVIVISDGLEAKAGSLSAGLDRFMAWKSTDGMTEASQLTGQIETLINGMLNRQTITDLIRHFIVFQQSKREDPKTGQQYVSIGKIVAAYHQYYAVNRAVESVKRAAMSGTRKGGVIWHTQGSGKSLSMVFFTGKMVLSMDNPTVVVITDRNDLDDQLFDTFAASRDILRQDPVQAESREHLKKLLSVASGGIVFTTIQKFSPEEGNVYDTLSERENIIVIADEAHRTQYGFKAKVDKETGEITYGFAKYMHEALPNATYIGFTGTPIEKSDRNTPAVFGNYIDIYDISRAVEDHMTVPIYYESRLAKINLSEDGKRLVRELDETLKQDEMSDSEKAKAKWTRLEALVGSSERVKLIAADIVEHFEKRQEVFEGKGMIVAMSRRIAADLYEEIISLHPEWHSDDLKKGAIKVVMTTSSSDGPKISKHHTTKEQRRMLAERMKDPEDPLKLVIVRDMWLTGFDVPCLHTMYIDKPMRGHTLMQAIARVNRVYKDKPGGLIVDYLGIAADLKEALSFYAESGGKGDPALVQEQAVALMQENMEVVRQMFYGFDYAPYFQADTGRKLSIILEAEEHILGLENGKKRYMDMVAALSKAFALAIPHDAAMEIRDEVAFFQAVRSRLAKFDRIGTGMTDEEMETAIRQVIDKAIVTDQVIDIFDAAGIKKPDISILSDEFLMEVRDMDHKNLAMEVLKKLLNEEIRSRMKKNLVQSRTLMERLEESIKRYHSKVITAAEVIDELIALAKQIKEMDREPEEMGLTDYEYAFYTALASNESAEEVMGKDKLRELAIVLYDRVKKNASIDWTVKDSARSKLRSIVKRTLRVYGYPPDMQELATETVLKQMEMIADEITAEA